jgi:seryl-tRNA synthetase
MKARQDALDEYLHRSNQQQSHLEWAAEKANTLFQEGQTLSEALELKESELEAATGQLQRALESLQRLEETHKQVSAIMETSIHNCEGLF